MKEFGGALRGMDALGESWWLESGRDAQTTSEKHTNGRVGVQAERVFKERLFPPPLPFTHIIDI